MEYMEPCPQQNISTSIISFESQQPSLSIPAASRRVLQETTINSQPYELEPTDFGRGKTATNSQATVASILEQRRRVRARAGAQDTKLTFPLQRVKQYQEYRARQRARQPQDAETKDVAIWPDEIEDAFIEALYRVPPIGRGKLCLHRKPHGRNELIAEYIFKKTGVRRRRKQVSSHIQVLKGKMENVPEFMRLVESSNAYDKNPFANEHIIRILTSDNSSAKDHESYPLSKALSYGMNGILDSEKTVHPVNFAMWVQRSGQEASLDKSLHTYASLGSHKPRRSVELESVPHWRSKFPHLGSLHQHGAINCQIVLFEASFDTMANLPSAPSSLCTQFEVTNSDMYDYHTWECKTKIYKIGRKLPDRSHQVTQVDSLDGTSKLRLPFASDFWSDTFTGIFAEMGQRSRLDGERNNDSGLEDDRTESTLREISVVQDLFATPTIGHGAPKRVAIFLWRFSKAKPEENGTVEWRNLIPPPSQILVNSSAPEDQYNESISEITESSDVLAIEPWQCPLSSSVNQLSETFETRQYTPVHSTPPHVHSPAPVYYNCFSQEMQQQILQDSLSSAAQPNCFTPLALGSYDDSVSYIHSQDDSQQQFQTRWQQYPSPFSDSQFQMQFLDVNVDCSVADAPSLLNVLFP